MAKLILRPKKGDKTEAPVTVSTEWFGGRNEVVILKLQCENGDKIDVELSASEFMLHAAKGLNALALSGAR